MSKKSKIPIALITQAFVLLFSIGSVVQKFAGRQEFLSLKFFLLYGLTLLINFIYAVAWQQILKHLPLAEAYSHRSMTVLWSLIFGYLFFQEAITLPMILGSLLIIAGVYLVQTDGLHKKDDK